ncbi:hypothetical protein FPRO04_12404 [Fusarium proliferatum]|nr:hypothetical protein FPRO04_12404 [Fusarium proliferatum]
MFRTTRQLFFISAITIISSLAVMPLVSFVREIRSYSDLEAPGVAFVLTPDHGTVAIFFGNGSSVAVARVEGTQAYKDLMLRQNTTLITTENASNLKRPVSQVWGLKERFWEQPKTMEDIAKAAVEPVLRGLRAAVEAYLGNSICFVKVAFSPQELNNGYLADIVAGAVRQSGLVEVWAERPTAPVLALFSKWLDEGDFGLPESLVLVIDKSEYGFQLALIYQEEGLADVFRHNYHLYTGTENATDRASSFQQALEDIIKPPFNYKFYGIKVPQNIKDLVIYGDNIWNPDFRSTVDATLDARLIHAAPFMRMWSYVQRRQIANQVRLDHQNHLESIEYARPRFRKRSFSSRNNTGTSGEVSQQEPSESHFLVQNTCEDDPLNPLNWPRSSRAKNIFVICFLVFTQCWAGSAISMGNLMASEEFGVGQVAENLSTAMFLFGVGTGALFVGPISETVGRNPTYLVATAFYLCFLVGSAMTPTFGGQVVCRYFVGLCASATLTINGASVNDQFRPVKRALVFPIVAWANVAAAFVVALLFLPETYFPLILSWKAKELRRVTGDQRYTSQHEQKHSFWKQMRETLPLPATFFRSEPVIIALGLYLVLLYILLFSFLSGFDYIFKETYKLEPGYQGSCFAAIAAGATAFVLCGPGLYEWARQHTERVRGASIQPEFRLWPAIVAAPFLPIALFWLGWTNYSTVSIWSGLGACFLFGIVLTSIYVSSYEYITDSYGEHSAIALGSITMSRYLIAGGMVMAARPMYEGIGIHWTMTVLGPSTTNLIRPQTQLDQCDSIQSADQSDLRTLLLENTDQGATLHPPSFHSATTKPPHYPVL